MKGVCSTEDANDAITIWMQKCEVTGTVVANSLIPPWYEATLDSGDNTSTNNVNDPDNNSGSTSSHDSDTVGDEEVLSSSPSSLPKVSSPATTNSNTENNDVSIAESPKSTDTGLFLGSSDEGTASSNTAVSNKETDVSTANSPVDDNSLNTDKDSDGLTTTDIIGIIFGIVGAVMSAIGAYWTYRASKDRHKKTQI